jgi:hypothetical protein
MASLWSSRDFHLPHRDLGISMGSWVDFKPSGKGLPSRLKPEALLGIKGWLKTPGQ